MIDFRYYRSFARSLFRINLALGLVLIIAEVWIYLLLTHDYQNPYYLQTTSGFVFSVKAVNPQLDPAQRPVIVTSFS